LGIGGGGRVVLGKEAGVEGNGASMKAVTGGEAKLIAEVVDEGAKLIGIDGRDDGAVGAGAGAGLGAGVDFF